MIKNTSYRVKSDVNTEEERLYYQIEEGAYVTTSTGVWTVWNGEWRKIYPSAGEGSGLGWVRYDDTVYTEENKFSLANGVKVTLPNNAGNIIRSHTGVDYYDSSTQKVTAEYENDLYMATVVFKYSAPNANQTFLRLQLEGGNGTPYERLGEDIEIGKGNDVMHEFHSVFQYYADSSFLTNGATWKITALGGTAQLWDIIFFISKVQSYA
jgi:hypothetical protein